MDRTTRAKIDSMLYEVRSFPERAPWDVDALARRYQTDPMVIRALLETEGVALVEDADDDVDPNQTTQVMSQDELGIDGSGQ
ncbi:MAG: hypothetical protein IPH07_10420 [Deltaproteobacteria bacterium]|nr:hypothetical protein [Deltaproteobacteria bacterium]MBK8237150.1 hypothetical protein [Deltaproteobacteria bacterium]MBK8718844.1 hypothetical protein [Deltaproteobacteria bacterium]MBP7291671.1 hypothetical protein [Nannocystaceae bacterium]